MCTETRGVYVVPGAAYSCTCGLFSRHQDLHWTMLSCTHENMVSLTLLFVFIISLNK